MYIGQLIISKQPYDCFHILYVDDFPIQTQMPLEMSELGQCKAIGCIVTKWRTHVHLKVEAITQLQLTNDKSFAYEQEQTQNCFLKKIWDYSTLLWRSYF